MSNVPLKSFRNKSGEKFTHSIDTSTDGTTIKDINSNVVMSVDSNAYCNSQQFEKLNGKFRTDEQNNWYHKSLTGVITKPSGIQSSDLLYVEREVFAILSCSSENCVV